MKTPVNKNYTFFAKLTTARLVIDPRVVDWQKAAKNPELLKGPDCRFWITSNQGAHVVDNRRRPTCEDGPIVCGIPYVLFLRPSFFFLIMRTV